MPDIDKAVDSQALFDECVQLMRAKNSGKLTAEELLLELELRLGKTGMDMMALWGVMCANEAVRNVTAGW